MKTRSLSRRTTTVVLLCTIAFATFLGGGCALTDYTVARRTEIDKAIATARADTETKLTALKEQEVKALRDTIATHNAREQSASDYLFKGAVTFGTLKQDQISRPTLVMGQSIQQTATQLPPATAAAQATAFKALQTELDETKVSTQALIAQYQQELGVAKAEGEAKAKALAALDAKVKAVETERAAVLGQALTKEQELQAAKDKVQDQALADKAREAAEAKSVQAMKLRFSSIAGGLALLCLAGAVYSPIGKDKFGIAAAVLGLAAVAIWYLQGWHVALAVGIAVLALIGWAAKNQYIQSRAATNAFRAIQAVKDNAREDYDRVLRPKLEEWMTTYDSKTGKPVPDKAAIAHVDKVLMEVGDK